VTRRRADEIKRCRRAAALGDFGKISRLRFRRGEIPAAGKVHGEEPYRKRELRTAAARGKGGEERVRVNVNARVLSLSLSLCLARARARKRDCAARNMICIIHLGDE
jgi:hypothetical protein